MNPLELAVGGALVVVLLGISFFVGMKQRKLRNELRVRTDLSTEDRIYLQGQVRRRLWCSFLLAALAFLLIGSYFLEPTIRELKPVDDRRMTEAERQRLHFFAMYWGLAVALLFSLLAFAGFDVIATAKYGMRQRRLLEESHRQELEAEAARLRQRRAELN